MEDIRKYSSVKFTKRKPNNFLLYSIILYIFLKIRRINRTNRGACKYAMAWNAGKIML